MITIKDKTECCGCNACGDICPKQAISFQTDIEGFWYPEVDLNKCVDCGLCEKVCPIINHHELKKNDYNKPSHVIAAINQNLSIRWDSTSGGVFSALAETVYEKGGYVAGAVYDENFAVHHFVSNNPEDLTRIRSSKYLQSNAESFYKEIKTLLKQGELVLCCGTPCQMAALRSFLGRDYGNLFIADFICRGVNSPKVYRAYLDSLEKKFHSKVVYVKAKNKELGWRNLTRKVVFENGEAYYGVGFVDDFRRGYHTNVFSRPSCYECKFKGFPRLADITLADFWGIERVDKNLDNDIGTSMILLNSRKGEDLFKSASSKLEYKEVPFESIIKGNGAIYKSLSRTSINREQFFQDLDAKGFDYVTNHYFPYRQPKSNGLRKVLSHFYTLYTLLGISIKPYIKFVSINKRKNTTSSFSEGKVIYPMPGAVFDISKTARIIVDKPIYFGYHPIKGLKVPTGLKMGPGTTFEIHDGPLTRYGDGPYNLRYGAQIEIINGGKLVMGDGGANVGLFIMCAKEITIGNGVRIGRNVSIRDWNGPHVIINEHYKNHAPVHIENNVWLCSGCSVMPGVTIGEGSVVAANATVMSDVPPKSLVAGTPAKVIKSNIEWY